jgi:hypothetical protein
LTDFKLTDHLTDLILTDFMTDHLTDCKTQIEPAAPDRAITPKLGRAAQNKLSRSKWVSRPKMSMKTQNGLPVPKMGRSAQNGSVNFLTCQRFDVSNF